MNGSDRLDMDRLGVISGALLLGMVIARFLESPVQPVTGRVLGSPLGINISLRTIALAVLVGMAITAAESIVRSHPLARAGEVERSYKYWIIPAALVLGLAGWQSEISEFRPWTLALIAGAILAPLSLALEYASVDPARREPFLRWGHLALAHVAAFLLFARIYDLRWRSLLSGSVVLLISAVLSWRLYGPVGHRGPSTAPYAAATGLLMGMMAWSLNYWPLSTLQGGVLLFILFYAIVGLIQQFLGGRSGRQVFLEYVGVTLLVVLLVFFGL